jgi:predicted RNase H-like HicB family nuclease
MNPFPFQITACWSVDDAGYVARVPALPGCLAMGSTPEAAVKQVKVAASAFLRDSKAKGRPLPELQDVTLARLQVLQPLLNLSAVARAAGLKVQTLSSKLRRGTALTEDEAIRLNGVLEALVAPTSAYNIR